MVFSYKLIQLGIPYLSKTKYLMNQAIMGSLMSPARSDQSYCRDCLGHPIGIRAAGILGVSMLFFGSAVNANLRKTKNFYLLVFPQNVAGIGGN